MGRLKKYEAAQITQVIYGINRETFKVERAYLTRGGELSLWRAAQRLATAVGRGRAADSECNVVFGMTDICVFPVSIEKSESEKRVIEELARKAEAMRIAGE